MDNTDALRLFVLKSISCIFTSNKVQMPSDISTIMESLNCKADVPFISSFGPALSSLIDFQMQPRKKLGKEDLDDYYRRHVMEAFNARDFLEFLVYNIMSSLMNIEGNSSGVVDKYNMIMNVIEQAKTRNMLSTDIFSQLKSAAEEVKNESIERLKNTSPQFLGTKRTRKPHPSTESSVALENVEDDFTLSMQIMPVESQTEENFLKTDDENDGDNCC